MSDRDDEVTTLNQRLAADGGPIESVDEQATQVHPRATFQGTGAMGAPGSEPDPYATVVEAKGHSIAPRPVTFSSMPPPATDEFGQRFGVGDLLGQGGMGEVRLVVDRRIGRLIAMKAIKPECQKRAKHRARFLFEAKVQGQLEHPSIVPVYD